jgi:hypothetical protein
VRPNWRTFFEAFRTFRTSTRWWSISRSLFLTGAALFYLLAWVLRVEKLIITAFMLLLLGAISAAAAVATGFYAEDGVMVSLSVRKHLLENHERFILVTLGLVSFWPFGLGAEGYSPKKAGCFLSRCFSYYWESCRLVLTMVRVWCITITQEEKPVHSPSSLRNSFWMPRQPLMLKPKNRYDRRCFK